MRKRLGIASAALACAMSANVAANVESDSKRLTEAATVLRDIHAAPDKDIPQ
jgi:hypothetical protein